MRSYFQALHPIGWKASCSISRTGAHFLLASAHARRLEPLVKSAVRQLRDHSRPFSTIELLKAVVASFAASTNTFVESVNHYSGRPRRASTTPSLASHQK